MLLTKAILNEALKSELQPTEIQKGLNDLIPQIHKYIDGTKKQIDVDSIGSVATISSESEEIGAIIQEIYKQIGKEGVIEVEHSNLPETFYSITEGVRLRNARLFSTYSKTDKNQAVYKKPLILITKEKITSVDQLDRLIGGLLM